MAVGNLGRTDFESLLVLLCFTVLVETLLCDEVSRASYTIVLTLARFVFINGLVPELDLFLWLQICVNNLVDISRIALLPTSFAVLLIPRGVAPSSLCVSH